MKFADKLRLVVPRSTSSPAAATGVPSVVEYRSVLDFAGADPRLRVLRAFFAEFAAGARVVTGLDAEWSRPLFLDTETTGLGVGPGTVAFLVGVAWVEEGRKLVVEQRLMSGFGAETELLRWVNTTVSEAGNSLVTYNGRTFDLPLLQARTVMQRLPALPRPPHLDLLHPARALWKGLMADCRLSTLEERVLGYRRRDDIPGSEIPQTWLRMVRANDHQEDGVGGAMEAIVRHNRDDLVSLAALAALVAALFCGRYLGGGAVQTELGHALLRRRDPAAARRAFNHARRLGADGERVFSGLALAARREQDWDAEEEALLAWLDGLERFNPEPYERLAILWEHRFHRFGAAAALIRRALERGARVRQLAGFFPPESEAALRHRLARLERRAAAAQSRPAPRCCDRG